MSNERVLIRVLVSAGRVLILISMETLMVSVY